MFYSNFIMQTWEEVKNTPETPCFFTDPSYIDTRDISEAIINQNESVSIAGLKQVKAFPLYDQRKESPMDLMCDESSSENAEFLEYDDTGLHSINETEDVLNKNSLLSNTSICIDLFSLLSDEIILHIFKFLPRWFLVKCSLVCKRWKKISYDMFLWYKYNMGERVVKPGVLEHLFSRGVVALRLATSEIKYPIFSPDFLNKPRLAIVQYLDLSRVSVSPEGLAEILYVCVHLKKLSLESCLVNDECLKNISNNTELSVLNFAMCRGITASGLGAIFLNCIKLTELNLAWIKLDLDDWLSILPSIPESIQRLNVSGHKETFNNECLLHVVNRCRYLFELDISDCRVISKKAFQLLLENCKELVHLHCSRSYRIPSDCYRLLKSLPKFRYLDIFNTILTATLDSLCEELPHVHFNKHVFSTIARPTTGKHMYSIWGIKTRDKDDSD